MNLLPGRTPRPDVRSEYEREKENKFADQMGIGMVLGIMAGASAQYWNMDPQCSTLGQLFINLVRMVVVPLVLATLVAGAASVGDIGRLGRVAGKTLVYYFASTAVASSSADPRQYLSAGSGA